MSSDPIQFSDQIEYDPDGPVLLVGGYGTVGSELCRLSARQWPLLLAGRSPQHAEELCHESGAQARRWDLSDPTVFRATARAVVSLVNDPDDRVLRAALRSGVPYLDVTRWTARLQRAVTIAALGTTPAEAPVLLSSGWMGGVVPLVAAALADQVGGADLVDTAVRYDTADRAGADSVEFMDRLGIDFEVTKDGQRRMVSPLRDTQIREIGPDRTKVARIDTPEQFTLPLTTGAGTVTTRIGFSSRAATSLLIGLGRAGLFRRMGGNRWQPMRRKLLYTPGTGGTARLSVRVRGPLGGPTATVHDPRGQAHLTAIGALLGLRRILGADGAPPPRGLTFPEQHPLARAILPALEAAGAQVELSTREYVAASVPAVGR